MKICISCWMVGLATLGFGLIFGGFALPADGFGRTSPEVYIGLGATILLAQATGLGAYLTWPRVK